MRLTLAYDVLQMGAENGTHGRLERKLCHVGLPLHHEGVASALLPGLGEPSDIAVPSQ